MVDSELRRTLETVLAPLIEADSGELYLLPSDSGIVRLHLGGRFSGCPGNTLVNEHVLRPAIAACNPDLRLEVSSGHIVPSDAERVRSVPLSRSPAPLSSAAPGQ